MSDQQGKSGETVTWQQLTLAMQELLIELVDKPETPVGDLSRIVPVLEKAGLVSSHKRRGVKGFKYVSITENGRALAASGIATRKAEREAKARAKASVVIYPQYHMWVDRLCVELDRLRTLGYAATMIQEPMLFSDGLERPVAVGLTAGLWAIRLSLGRNQIIVEEVVGFDGNRFVVRRETLKKIRADFISALVDEHVRHTS